MLHFVENLLCVQHSMKTCYGMSRKCNKYMNGLNDKT